MDRTERKRKFGKLKLRAGLAALVGLALFSGLAAASTRQQRRGPALAQQLNNLENDLGFPFWDTASNTVSPPTYVSNPPQTSSGAS